MRDEIEAAVILLGDQPLVGSRTVAALLRAWRREGSRPAVAVSQAHGEWRRRRWCSLARCGSIFSP